MKYGARTRTSVQLYAMYTHNSHAINKGQGCGVLWGDRKLCNFLNPINSDKKIPTLQMNQKLILVEINEYRIYACVEFSN